MAAQALLDSKQVTTAVEEFLASIDDLIEEYGLDPQLPEIQQLKERAETIIRFDSNTKLATRNLCLLRVNPHHYVEQHNGSLVIMQGVEDSVLSPCYLIRYHLRSLDLSAAIQKIIVDQTGTYIYDGDGRELVRCPAGADDANKSLRLAALIVSNFTWLEVTPQDLWQVRRATFCFTGDEWVMQTHLRTAA